MPYYAEVNQSGEVLRVIVANSKEWCETRLGGTWIETRDPYAEQQTEPELEVVEYCGPGMGSDLAHPKRFARPWSADGQTQFPDGGWLYAKQGQVVFHNGKVWTNLLPDGTPNIWEPGISNWRQYQIGNEYTIWLQPTGAFDSYPEGFIVEHNGQTWRSNTPNNVWEPGAAGITQWDSLSGPAPSDNWQTGISYSVGDEVNYEGTIYRCRQSHTSQVGWQPPIVPALWEVI